MFSGLIYSRNAKGKPDVLSNNIIGEIIGGGYGIFPMVLIGLEIIFRSDKRKLHMDIRFQKVMASGSLDYT
jgi:hypothetical protein